MYIHRLFIFTLLTSMVVHQAQAAYWDAQSGSLMGLVHLSVGEAFFSNHHLSAGLGYVPKLDNHPEMSLLSLRYRYQHPYRFQLKKQFFLSPLNLGLSVLVGSHKELFVQLPQQYPDDYYAPTAVRMVLNYQSILHLSQKTQLYFDISILDVGLISYVREPNFFRDNYRYLGLAGITSWGLGLRRRF